MTEKLYTRSAGFVSTDMDGETVMLDVERGTYFGIRGVGNLVWERLDTPRTVDQLVRDIRATYDVAQDKCREDVATFLQELERNGMVVVR